MKVESGQVVALLIKRCVFLIAAMFGGSLAGDTCLYSDPQWPDKRVRTFEKDAKVRVIIGESNIGKHDADEFSLWSSSIRDTSDLSTETTGTSHSTDCENWPIAIGHALAKIPLEIVDSATLNVVRNEAQAGELLIPSTYNMERVHRSLSTEMHLPWCDRYRSLFVVDVSPSAPYVHGHWSGIDRWINSFVLQHSDRQSEKESGEDHSRIVDISYGFIDDKNLALL